MFLENTATARPQVTIGMCVRNCEIYLKEALESIVSQVFPHNLLELVIVDDGSEDRTLETAKQYASKIDFPVKILHTTWKGLGYARNMVVANANGDYILWVDGDMLLSKDFVATLFEFMEKNKEAGISKGKQSLQPSENTLSTLEAYSRAAGRMVNYQSKKTQFRSLGTGGAIYRTEAIRQVGGFDENLRGYGEDWDAEIRIRAAGWSLYSLNVEFSDYERYKMNWKSLWRRYWLRGYYTHYFSHKNRGFVMLYRMFPAASFISGLVFSRKLYVSTGKKIVFLLPLQHAFKMSAWFIGFISSHFNSYNPC